jgi:homeobox protein cut-like
MEELLSTLFDHLLQPSPARMSPIPFTSAAETSILPIVTSQRDRFRARNAELEDELRRQFQTMAGLRGEVKTLQADNLKLYEKVRYMQSYREGAAPSARALTGGASVLDGRADALGRYGAQYEESMNPFNAFRGRVRPFLIAKNTSLTGKTMRRRLQAPTNA